jgi:hypothetical protein
MSRRRRSLGLLLGVALAAPGCSFWRGEAAVPADESFGVEVVDGPAILEFHRRASTFYGRLAQRRFNVIATFRDQVLRDYFRTDRSFSDYYADFAEELEAAHFERNVPTVLDVLEFRFEGPGEARVRVRVDGRNGLPLRVGQVQLEREDHWERVGGTWWIVPGKL